MFKYNPIMTAPPKLVDLSLGTKDAFRSKEEAQEMEQRGTDLG